MSIAEHSASHLIIIVAKHNAASCASEAPRVELLAPICLQVLAFDSTIAALAQGSVECVVVLLAIRRIVEDVEFGTGKRILAGAAYETFLVVAAS